MSWSSRRDGLEKRCSSKQLFWKLPKGIFSQNPWKISLKKFVFSKVALSRSWKFLPKKETSKKTIFTKFFIRETLQGTRLKVADCQPATLLKMNFFIGIFQGFWLKISEHLFQVAASIEVYSGPCQTSKMELFCEYN